MVKQTSNVERQSKWKSKLCKEHLVVTICFATRAAEQFPAHGQFGN